MIRCKWISVIFSCLNAASFGAYGFDPAATPVAAQKMLFAWPSGAKAHVTEKVTKNTESMEFAYTIAAVKSEQGGLQVDYSDFDVIRFNGQDAHNSQTQQAMQPVIAIMASFPSLQISPAGKFVRAVDLDKMLQRTLTILEANARHELTDEQKAAARKTLESAGMRNMLTQKVAEGWRVWVELWIGAELASGKKETRQAEIALGDTLVSAPSTREYLGIDATKPGRAQLRSETVLAGDDAARALETLIIKISRGAPNAPKSSELAVQKFERTSIATVVIDPKTMLPYSARLQALSKFEIDGREGSQSESHEYTFDWISERGEQ